MFDNNNLVPILKDILETHDLDFIIKLKSGDEEVFIELLANDELEIFLSEQRDGNPSDKDYEDFEQHIRDLIPHL